MTLWVLPPTLSTRVVLTSARCILVGSTLAALLLSGCATMGTVTPMGQGSVVKRSGLAEKVANHWPGADIQKPKEVFDPNDPQVTWWAEFPPMTFLVEPKFVARWYSPDEALFKEENFSAFWGNYQWAAVSLPIQNGLARSMQGEWHVEVFSGGRLIDRKSFFIGTPEVRRYAQSDRAQKDAQLTLTFLPCYDDLTGGRVNLLKVNVSYFTDPQGELRRLERTLQGTSDDAAVWVQVGWVKFLSKDRTGATEAFQKAKDLRPESGFIQNLLGMAQASWKRYAEAETSFVSAAQAQPNSPQIHFNLGEARLALGKYEQAKSAYEQAMGFGLENKTLAQERIALIGRAMANQWQAAKNSFQPEAQAVEALDTPEGMMYLGAVLYAGKRYEESIAVLRKALEKKSNLSDARILLGMIYLDKEFPEQAEKEFLLAVDLDTSRVEAHVGLAAAYMRLKEYDQAEAQLHQALVLAPQEAKAHELLGDLYQAKEQYEEALGAYHTAVTLAPASARTHLGMATCLRATENYERAVQEYEEVLRVAPNNVDAHIGLGSCYQSLGNLVQAEEELKRAMRLEPQRQEVAVLYQELLRRKKEGPAATEPVEYRI